jgi:hypothetical protein
MKIAALISSVVLVSAFAAPRAGFCKTVSLQSEGTVKAGCGGAGDMYMSKTKDSNGTYGCMKQDGSGIVCGGVGRYAKSCGTFRKLPPRLPSQAEIEKAEKNSTGVQ